MADKAIGSEIKQWRTVHAYIRCVILVEIFVMISRLVLATTELYLDKSIDRIPMFSIGAIIHILKTYGKFLVSVPNFWLILSLLAVICVHQFNLKAVKTTPSRRYKIITPLFTWGSLFQMVAVFFSCIMFVQSLASVFGISMKCVYECERLTGGNQQPTKTLCINEKTCFTVYLVGLLAAWEFVLAKISGSYILQFSIINKPFFDHLKLFLMNNWKTPLKRGLFGFTILLVLYKLIFRQLFTLVTYLWFSTAFVDDKLESMLESVELKFIFTSVICSYIAVFYFLGMLKLLNYILVQRPNFPIHLVIPNPNAILLQDAIAANDDYAQSLGWFDLFIMSKINKPNLISLFTLSHPGNNPNIWNKTLNSCIELGNNAMDGFKKCIALQKSGQSTEAEAEYIFGEIKHFNARGEGLTMFTNASPFVDEAFDTARDRRRMIGRDLTTTTPIQPVRKVKTKPRLTRIEIMTLGPILIGRWIRNSIVNMFTQWIPKIKSLNVWKFWMEEDQELMFINSVSKNFMLVWAISGIVEAISFAISSSSSAVFHRDIYRINQFFIDLYEEIQRIGKVVPNKIKATRVNNAPVEVYSETKEEFMRLEGSVKFFVAKYVGLVSPYFNTLSIPIQMQDKLHAIVEEREAVSS